MKNHIINPADVSGDHSKQIASHFGQGISKELIIRTHINPENQIFTFLEVYNHCKMVYSGGDLAEAVQIYNDL